MSRSLTSSALLLAAILLAGCAEESLDVPIVVPDDVGPTTHLEDTDATDLPPSTVHDWIGQPRPGFESEVAEAEEPSAVNSIWNALLEGTAQATDESAPQP